MNTINHALWGATIGRTVGLPVEGAVIASIPDLISIPPLAFFSYKNKLKPNQSPKWTLAIYQVSHNWLLAILFILFLRITVPSFWILGLGYFWHVFEDAFLHTGMATQFLWPIWKGKIQIISAGRNKWIQIIDFLIIIGVNIFYWG